jgi:hypothetical protein
VTALLLQGSFQLGERPDVQCALDRQSIAISRDGDR